MGGEVTLSKPFSTLPKDQRQHINEIVRQCKAAQALAVASGAKEPSAWLHDPIVRVEEVLTVADYTALSETQCRHLLYRGLARIKETVPHLKFKA